MILHLSLVASGSITLTLFISAADAPVGLITIFITLFFTVDNEFVSLFLRYYATFKMREFESLFYEINFVIN